MRNRPRGSQMGLMLLAMQVFQVGVDNIPPVTLAVLGLNLYLYLCPAAPLLMSCVSVQQAWHHGDWRRLFLSPLHHLDDWHIYFNMASFLWKGIKLERLLGGPWFAYLLSVFSLLTGLVYLALEAGLSEVTGDASYSMQCAVGFSGVLFALKVVNNHYHPGAVTHVMGVPVANRYASWAELVLIHITSPGTSFIGHLAGILVGLLYTSGPLKTIMKTCAAFVTSSGNNFRPNNHYSTSGYSGSRERPLSEDQQYDAAVRNSLNDTGGYSGSRERPLSEDQQYNAAVRNSLNDTGGGSRQSAAPPPYEQEVTAEEIRRRRLMRLDLQPASRGW